MISSLVLMVPLSSNDPTVIIFLLMPGEFIVSAFGPEFPAAATTTIPSSQSLLTAFTKGSLLSDKSGSEPIDKETILILYLFLFFNIQSIPATISEVLPAPFLSIDFMAIIFA